MTAAISSAAEVAAAVVGVVMARITEMVHMRILYFAWLSNKSSLVGKRTIFISFYESDNKLPVG